MYITCILHVFIFSRVFAISSISLNYSHKVTKNPLKNERKNATRQINFFEGYSQHTPLTPIVNGHTFNFRTDACIRVSLDPNCLPLEPPSPPPPKIKSASSASSGEPASAKGSSKFTRRRIDSREQPDRLVRGSAQALGDRSSLGDPPVNQASRRRGGARLRRRGKTPASGRRKKAGRYAN